MNDLKKRLMLIDLRNLGYNDAVYDADKDAIMPNHTDFPSVGITEDGFIFQKPDSIGSEQSSSNTPSVSLNIDDMFDFVYREFEPIRAKVNELAYAWENATNMMNEGLNNYRLLSAHGNVVFAARDDGVYGFQFATWQCDYDRKGFEHGHYIRDYDAAKSDFAVRSGLVREDSLFKPEQLAQIYSALVFQGKHDDKLTFDTESDLQSIIEKLEKISPDLKDSNNELHFTEQDVER